MHYSNNLEWKNLKYSVSVQRKRNFFFFKNESISREVLKDVSGCVQSGRMVAILGPSGAGKTTLLAGISQRLRGNIEGSIQINGIDINRKKMTKLTSFLPQFNIFTEGLTAFEHLIFMCYFKLEAQTSKLVRKHTVDYLLHEVGLSAKSNTLVANLSAGEKRRLGIGEQLICNPLFIFCDEPTTGLDSFNALSVIKTLKCLTESEVVSSNENIVRKFSKGVICSIHQPTSELFEVFTDFILISQGKILYQGSREDAYGFFSRFGMYCPGNCNPAEFYIQLASNEKTCYYLQEVGNAITDSEVMYHDSIKQQNVLHEISNVEYLKQINWICQLYYLLLRILKNIRVTLYGDFLKTIFLLITGFTFAIIYQGVAAYDQTAIQNIQGLLFMLTTEIIFTSTYAVIYEFPASLPLIRRDVGENLYSLSAYYVAQLVCRIPHAFIQSFLFLGIIFLFTSIIKELATYITMSLTLSIASLAAISYGLLLSSLFESTRLASEISSPFDLLFLLHGGFYMNLDSTSFLKYISLFFYCNEALSYDFWNKVDVIECPSNFTEHCILSGSEVLHEYALSSKPDTMLTDYFGLLAIFAIMNVIAFILVLRHVKKTGYY